MWRKHAYSLISKMADFCLFQVKIFRKLNKICWNCKITFITILNALSNERGILFSAHTLWKTISPAMTFTAIFNQNWQIILRAYSLRIFGIIRELWYDIITAILNATLNENKTTLTNYHTLHKVFSEFRTFFPVRCSDNSVHFDREIGEQLKEIRFWFAYSIKCFWSWSRVVIPVFVDISDKS